MLLGIQACIVPNVLRLLSCNKWLYMLQTQIDRRVSRYLKYFVPKTTVVTACSCLVLYAGQDERAESQASFLIRTKKVCAKTFI